MRYFLFIALLTVFESTPAKSQAPEIRAIIRGVVLDPVTLSAVPSATIALYRDKQLIGGAFTDSAGRFILNVQQSGNYSIRISHMGYQPYQSASFSMSAHKNTVEPGSLALIPRVETLPAVRIAGQKPLIGQRADGFVFKAENPKLYTDLSVFFNDNRNSIENIRRPLPGGLFESSWQNTGRDRRLGMSASLIWKPAANLNLSAIFMGQYVWLKSPALRIAHTGLMRELVANGSYRFPKGFSISFYGFFDARNFRIQGYRSGWKYYSVTLGKKSKNERLEVSLKMDAFLTPYSYINEEVVAASFYQKQTFRYQNQNFRLSFSVRREKLTTTTGRYRRRKREIRFPSQAVA